jgi:cytochrome P450
MPCSGALRQSLVVAMIAPSILLGQICVHLAADTVLQQKLRETPSDIPAAIEEFVRMYTPYRGFARTVSKETSLHGRTIKPGEPITMTYSAANRDPDQFENPDQFVLNRENIASHLGFGRGRHRCVGMPLARLALQTALRVILSETRGWEVNGELEWSRMPEMGIISCPLKFTV